MGTALFWLTSVLTSPGLPYVSVAQLENIIYL